MTRPKDESRQRKSSGARIVGVLVAFCVAALLAAVALNEPLYTFIIPEIRRLVTNSGRSIFLLFAILVLVIIAASGLFGSVVDTTRRAGILIMIGVPALVIVFVGATISNPIGLTVVRIIFLVSVVMLPGYLFFLFITTRREGLMNSYAANLDRLGLLSRRVYVVSDDAEDRGDDAEPVEESEMARQFRVRSYLDRFAAVYGRLPPTYVEAFLTATDADAATRPDQQGLPNLSHWATELEFDLKTLTPVFGMSILTSIGWIAVLPVVPEPMPSPATNLDWFNAPPAPVGLAFLGAYFFSIQMIVRRFVRKDLGPNAYIQGSLRIILSVIGAWVATATLPLQEDGAVLLAMAFAIGVFPLVVWQVVGSVLARGPGGVILPSLRADEPLTQLDGLSVWHESRLEEEDIENVQNMATADLPDLMLNTKLPPHRLIEWVDQAILYITLGPEDPKKDNGGGKPSLRQLLHQHGIRTATGLVDILGSDAGKHLTADKELSGRILTLAAALPMHANFQSVQRWKSMRSQHPAQPTAALS